MEAQELAEVLSRTLKLASKPVAVQLEPEAEWEPLEVARGYRVCQALFEASEGRRLVLDGKRTACSLGAHALFGKPLPQRLGGGPRASEPGLVASDEVFRKIAEAQPALAPGAARVAFAPLETAPALPHLVAIRGTVEQLMWLTRALIWHTGEPLAFETYTLQSACVDTIARPLVTGKPGLSLGCCGLREATGWDDGETSMGLPLEWALEAGRNLPELEARIRLTRERGPWEFLEERKRKGKG